MVSGDVIPEAARVIELRVPQLRRLFNQMDPSPFHDRDLDPNAEQFILGWSRELPRDAPLALAVHLDRSPGHPDEATMLRGAVQLYFQRRSTATHQRLRQMFRRGRISLLIGICFLVLAIAINRLLIRMLHPSGFADVLNQSLVIGGWVAMWRPIEFFLYDWWPVQADRKLFDRLASMPVQIRYSTVADPSAASQDWPMNDERTLVAMGNVQERA